MTYKRFLCLLLAVIACFGCSAAAAEGAGAPFLMAGYDNTQYRDWKTNRFFSRMEELTGVQFVYQQYSDAAEWRKAKEAMTAGSDSLPDVLFKAALSGLECMEMRERGVLIDLKPFLAESCPHLWAILEANPDYLAAITLPDGSIAALPFLAVPSTQNCLWINREWLNNLRMDAPATAQELVNVLEAMKSRDANRNGKADEIPLGFLGPFDLKFLAHAFGLIANDYNIFAAEGQVRFMPLEENFRLFVTWCRDLYQAGLLDKDGFSITDEMRTVTDSNAVPKYGVIMTTIPADLFRVSWADQYEILMPLEYEGKQIYRSFAGNVFRGTFAVTSHCADPARVLAWVDCLYTEEGAVLSGIGQENVDFLVDGDGSWRLLETNQNNYEMYRADTLIEGGAENPGILSLDFQRRMSGSDMVRNILDAQVAFDQYAVLPFPYYTLTREQEQEIAPLQERIGSLVDLSIARWVLGEEEITDASFAAFEEQLNAEGLQEFLRFWQDVLDKL